AYADLIQNALPVLQRHGFTAAVFVVSKHLGGSSTWDIPLGYPSRPLMAAEQGRQAKAQGFEIGAHTRTHPDLRTLDHPELISELEGCRKDLEALTGAAVTAFAYPFGAYNEVVRGCANDFFALAFSCKPGLNNQR